MTQQILTRWAFSAALIAAIAGCGTTTTPGAYDPNAAYTDPNGQYGGTTGYTDPSSAYAPDVAPTAPPPSYATGAVPGPSSYGPTVAAVTPKLTMAPMDKKVSGILFWKHLTVSGQVRNATTSTLSGEVEVSFTKSSKVVETQYEFVKDLAPGQSHSFSLVSKKSADDAESAVNSEPGSTQSNVGGSYGTTTTPYGSTSSPYGSTTYPTSTYPTTSTGYGY